MKSKDQLLQIIGQLPEHDHKYLCRLFENCPDEVISTIKHTRMVRDEVLIHSAAPSRYVYIIIKGKAIGLDLPLVGSVYLFMEFPQMSVVGDFEIFGGISEYRATIRAATDGEVLIIPSAVYLEWMKKDVNALFMRTQNLMNGLSNQTSGERKWFFSNCKKRLMLYLVESYEKNGSKGQMKLQKTQTQLAERLGFHVRSVQRSIQKLKKEERISVEGGKICMNRKQYGQMKLETE